MTSKEFRRIADEKIAPHLTTVVVAFLLYVAVMGFATGTMIGGLILAGPLTLGLTFFVIQISKGETPQIETLFKGFENFVNAMILWLIQMVFVFLWSLLFFIPGIIKYYAYSLSFYLLQEDPTIDPMFALKKSEEMMKDHKWRLFCLEFSYIGWLILCVLTFGILYLWVGPKMALAKYEFYLDIKKNRGTEVVDIKEIR